MGDYLIVCLEHLTVLIMCRNVGSGYNLTLDAKVESVARDLDDCKICTSIGGSDCHSDNAQMKGNFF